MAQAGMTDQILTSVEMQEDAMLDCRRGLATANPCPPPAAETAPLPARMRPGAEVQKSPAEWAYERIILYVKNFEEQLDAEHEVAMGFTGGDAGVLRIEGLGWFAPDILSFYGEDEDGARTQLIQHVTQLNVMLRALPKAPEATEARRIGFHLAKGLGFEEPAPAEPKPKPRRRPAKPVAAPRKPRPAPKKGTPGRAKGS